LARTIASATADAARSGIGRRASRRASRERNLPGPRSHARLALALALLVAGCGGPPPVRCQGYDLDDKMMSTRTIFLERLAGCPIGGRH
jgi:hypothetical protein